MKLDKILLTITVLLLCKIAFCQEVLTPLHYNPMLAIHDNYSTVTRSQQSDTVISLPFIDDFSYSQKYPYKSKYPNPALWMDSDVYINDDYGVGPPTVGVATFDGLNKYGQPYNYAPFAQGWADSLTSRPINLRESSPSDSIYLSFFYQPQGNGDPPTTDDSLVLEFRDTTGNFVRVWSVYGDSLDSFIREYNEPFKQIIIPVKDLKYFHPGFQFRFRNFAETSGNNNNWNIDYVKMSAGRHSSDTVLNDVAFQYNSQSILANYTQMPWYQFYTNQQKELRTSYNFSVINNFAAGTPENNVNFEDTAFNLTDNTGLRVYGTPNAVDMAPGAIVVKNFPTFNIPTDVSFSSSEGDSVAAITVRTNIKAVAPYVNQLNDTIYHTQYFYNYFAYDDGTPETAYSLLGNGAAPELAYKFMLNRPDTLQAIQIFFTRSNAQDSGGIFVLEVWSNVVDTGHLIYDDSLLYSEATFLPDSLNGFVTYKIKRPFLVSDSMYIGFLQTNPTPLYIGFDVNDNDSMNLYYNVGSGFQQSQFHGALMMRPVLGRGKGIYSSGIAPSPQQSSGSLLVYPDPVKDVLRINVQNTTITDANLSVENILGQSVITQSISLGNPSLGDLEVNVSTLPAGMYFIRVTNKKSSNALSAKFVKTN